MALKFKLVRNDTLPEIYLLMDDGVTGAPIDLSNPATVIRMYFRKVGESALKDTLVLVKLPGLVTNVDEDTGAQTVDVAPPYDVPGIGGRCSIQFGPTTLDTAGQYQGEIEITFVGGGRLTWYETLTFSVREDFNEDA